MHEMIHLVAWWDDYLHSKHYITSKGHNFKTNERNHMKFSHVSTFAKSNTVLRGEVCSLNTFSMVRRGLKVSHRYRIKNSLQAKSM